MKIIADSGSTKCDWVYLDDGTLWGRTRTAGFNPALSDKEQIAGVLSRIRAEDGDSLYFYGAGCGSSFPETTRRMERLLRARFTPAHLEIHSDLLGAARALLGRKAGIACILGTGSNSCHYDGEKIVQNVPSLGYILGDEGSGAVLGRNLVNGIFKGSIPLRKEFLREYELTYEEVIRQVYREPAANRFLASFVPFIQEHLECPEVREMVRQSFAAFVERNLKPYDTAGAVSFVGGVACAFEKELRSVLEQYGYQLERVDKTPMQGLIKYHAGR